MENLSSSQAADRIERTGCMKRTTRMAVAAVALCGLTGCALQGIKSKSKFGPEFRHCGDTSTESVRWTAQQGFEFEWDRGISTTLTYRRRDTDDGAGNHDDGVWFEFGFPIWKAKKRPDELARRLEALEERLAELEQRATQD